MFAPLQVLSSWNLQRKGEAVPPTSNKMGESVSVGDKIQDAVKVSGPVHMTHSVINMIVKNYYRKNECVYQQGCGISVLFSFCV